MIYSRKPGPFIPPLVSASFAALVTTSVCAAPLQFDLPQQPLQTSLSQVASRTGFQLTGDVELLAGKTAAALHASLEPEEAVRRLALGAGVDVRVLGAQIVVGAAAVQLAPVTVAGARPAEGRAADGYKSSTSAVAGPLGTTRLQDTPYTVTVVPAELIQNLQITTTDDVFRISPLTQLDGYTGRNTQTYVNLRGFTVTNQAIDGLKIANFVVDAVEDKERVEIFSGLSGFLYGQASPGGMINYVLKRPTAARFADVTAGDVGGSSGYAHVDAGGPIDADGRFGYRVNLVRQAGETATRGQHHERALVSGALDWHLTPDALVQVDYSRAEDELHGVPAAFQGLGTATVPYPAASSFPNDMLWAPRWTYTKSYSNQGGARLTWVVDPTLSVRSAFEIADTRGAFATYQNGDANAAGQIRPFVGGVQNANTDARTAYTYLDKSFETGVLRHKATVGFSVQRLDSYSNVNYTQNCLSPSGTIGFANCTPTASSPFNLFVSTIDVPEPANFANVVQTPLYKDSNSSNTNFIIADTISLGEQWQLLAGVNHSDVKARSFDTAGAVSGADYDASKWTPNISLLYKPLQELTTYLTYIQGLEAGQVVGTGYTNTGAVLPPLTSRQYELGAKLDTGAMLWTAALFDIDKPNQYSNLATPTPTYVQDGRQRHRGIDVTATGRLTPGLSIVAGGTWFDAKVKDSNNPALIDKTPQSVSEKSAKAYLEYRLPFLAGLSVNGGVAYFSKFAFNATDTGYLPSVTLADVGARYETTAAGRPLTLRLSVSNVFARDYWLSAGTLGEPRTVAFTGTMSF